MFTKDMNMNGETEKVYKVLKDFQIDTVEFAYTQLKKNKKFLVADEVGLGKTMIAKGIIAKTIDELKDKDKVEIVYITTNQAIAAQNIETLKLDNNNKNNKQKRLSLLITALQESSEKINFRSFTVGTSLEFKGASTGIKEERLFLVYLLIYTKLIDEEVSTQSLKSFFQGQASYDNFTIHRNTDPFNIKNYKEFLEIFKRNVFEQFHDFLKNKKDKGVEQIKNVNLYIKKYIIRNILEKTNHTEIIRNLRKALVKSNLTFLSPDLIILDEFQRFSKLLTDDNFEDKDIIEALFTSETNTLLLSATPYKLLDCKTNDHYQEFYGIVNWLTHNNTKEIESLKELFNNLEETPDNKNKIEEILLQVMCRTERLKEIDDGLVKEKNISLIVKKPFLDEYKKHYELKLAGLDTYLKSAPNPLNFMKPYSGSKESGYLTKKEFLSRDGNKSAFKELHQNHPKLDALKKTINEMKLDTLIWMPPINPHIKQKSNNFTKILIFSKWDFVPDSIIYGISPNLDITHQEAYINEEELHNIRDLISPYEASSKNLTYAKILKNTQQEFKMSNDEALYFLASPANCIYRSLNKYMDLNSNNFNEIKNLSKRFMIFTRKTDNLNKIRNFFNKKDERRLNIKLILQYFLMHNIQGMFDEYFHLITDSPKFKNKHEKDKLEDIGELFDIVFGLKANTITYDEFEYKDGKHLTKGSKFAMRISKSSVKENYKDDEKPLTAQNIKEAFNSPFAPFVLATTSIGQEGLDFHTYCNQIWHWEIPSNPVDMEQREGRIHRYKNYAVRKNIASKYPNDDWVEKFEKAKLDTQSDFKTFWVFDGDHKIERVIPILPFTKDTKRYEKLKYQLLNYRKAIGRINQKELINSNKNLKYIDLSPRETRKTNEHE